jgi:hypothetical protein
MSNPITVSDEAVEAALTAWSAAAWDNIRRTLAKEGGTLPDPAAAMRTALEAAAPFMREVPAPATEPMSLDDFEAWLKLKQPGARPTPALRKAWERYRAANPPQAQPAPSVGEAQFPRVWAVVEEYRRRHEGPGDPSLPSCEVCEMLRVLDRALSASTPEEKP